MARSQAFRRPPGLHTLSSGDDAEDEDDADSSGGFLPFAAAAPVSGTATATGTEDPSATIRTTPSRRTTISERSRPSTQHLNTISSSASSGSSSMAATGTGVAGPSRTQQRPSAGTADKRTALRSPNSPADALSSRRRAELAKLSPRLPKKKDGSDGTPSMGSSYSDLDGE